MDLPRLTALSDAFMKYDYAETKDLCKHFLTLLSGVLVFSVAFADKIVNYVNARSAARSFLLCCWVLLVAAIIACGIGLTYLALAGGEAVYFPERGYPP